MPAHNRRSLRHLLCVPTKNEPICDRDTSFFNTEISVPLPFHTSDLSLVLTLLESSAIRGRGVGVEGRRGPLVAVAEGNDRAKKYRSRTVLLSEYRGVSECNYNFNFDGI